MRRRRGKLDSERHTLAVCHHHKLCTLSAFGLSDRGTPFLPRKTFRRRRFRASRVGPRRPVWQGMPARHRATRPPLPTPQSTPTGAWRRILVGKIFPASAAPQDPEDAFKHLVVGNPFSSSLRRRLGLRQQRLNLRPLFVRQLASASGHRKDSFRHRWYFLPIGIERLRLATFVPICLHQFFALQPTR